MLNRTNKKNILSYSLMESLKNYFLNIFFKNSVRKKCDNSIFKNISNKENKDFIYYHLFDLV